MNTTCKLVAILSFTLGTAALITAAAGCNHQRTVHSSASMTVAGREIKASIDVPAGTYPDVDPAKILAAGKTVSAGGPIAIYSENDAASIRFGSHEVRVEKDRLLLDGKESAKIPASATHVEVIVSDTTLAVAAESTNILTTKIER
ncbi:MAG TPA: hypothetical protein VN578_24715 [Candidatus Binatia bacterium]|nr:hypothetical protein [Candidatus Binatia bacterium]